MKLFSIQKIPEYWGPPPPPPTHTHNFLIYFEISAPNTCIDSKSISKEKSIPRYTSLSLVSVYVKLCFLDVKDSKYYNCNEKVMNHFDWDINFDQLLHIYILPCLLEYNNINISECFSIYVLFLLFVLGLFQIMNCIIWLSHDGVYK